MGCLVLILPLLIVLPVVLALLFFDVVTLSFDKIGLSQEAALVIFFAMLIGGLINIPISRRRFYYREPQPFFSRFFYYVPPRVAYQVVAVNVGGALLPTGLALYLLPRAPLVPTLIVTAIIIAISRLVAKPVVGVGIVMPGWLSPIISALLAYLLARDNPAPVAYISGTMGTLIGADLLNWPNFKKFGPQLISIGGAGVFDGVFLSGVIAVLLTSL